MEDLIELATYHDEQYGLVVQFLDSENNTKFYALEEINGEKIYTKLDEETNRILEDKYIAGETTYDNGGTQEVYTSEKLFELLKTYPFKIEVYIDDVLYDGTSIPMGTDNESVELKFKVNWDYEIESNDQAQIDAADVIDTYWGNKAYDFDTNHPDEHCIEIEVKIRAVQSQENP